MLPIEWASFNFAIRKFGENINMKKHNMREGYKKRGERSK